MTTPAAETTAELIDFSRLDREARFRLRDEMIALHELSFAASPGATPAALAAYRAENYDAFTDPAIYDRYLKGVFFRVQGRLVGFFHVFVQWIHVEGERVEVIRASTVTHPEHRAAGALNRAFVRICADYTRRHALASTPRVVSGRCFSPLVYDFVSKRARHIFPSPRPDVDPQLRRIFRTIQGSETDWLVPAVIGTFEPPARQAQIASSRSPHVRFYKQVNPNYASGLALRVVIRASVSDLFYALAVSAGLAGARKIRRSVALGG